MRTLVVCPSRNRPEFLATMVESILKTSKADVAVYIDNDQVDLYRNSGILWGGRFGERLLIEIGPRIGPARAIDKLAMTHLDYDVFGLSTDDSIYKSPGWDKFTERAIREFDNRIGVVSAAHGGGPWVNFPYVSREWITTLGWYVCPGVTHYCWDTCIEILGDATNIVYATKKQFEIDHQAQPTQGIDRFALDGALFLGWCINQRPVAMKKLRAAMGKPVEVA